MQPSNSNIYYYAKNNNQNIVNSQFFDKDFPHNNLSIYGQPSKFSRISRKYQNIQWQKLTQLYPNAKLVVDQIQPNDIIQGDLDNCYFLASLAALAQVPQRIQKIFLNNISISKDKHFKVKMLDQGKEVIIDLDQWIPCKGKSEVFAKSVNYQIWVILLQKAWAKLYKSYINTGWGSPSQALHGLTGAPCYQILLNNKVWRQLVQISKKNYPSIAGSVSVASQSSVHLEITQKHAYTFLDAFSIYDNYNKYYEIVSLRNPFGTKQPKTSISDDSQFWDKIPESYKEKINKKNKNKNDGVFFMLFEDFLSCFNVLFYAQVEQKCQYIYCTQQDRFLKGVLFDLKIYQKGIFTFQLDKPSKRITHQIKYPIGQIIIINKDNQQIEVQQREKIGKATFSKTFQAQPGNYLIKAFIYYQSKENYPYQVTLGIYTDKKCELSASRQGKYEQADKHKEKNQQQEKERFNNYHYSLYLKYLND